MKNGSCNGLGLPCPRLPVPMWLLAQQSDHQLPNLLLALCAWAWLVQAVERVCLGQQRQSLSWCLPPCCLCSNRTGGHLLVVGRLVTSTSQQAPSLPQQWEELGWTHRLP